MWLAERQVYAVAVFSADSMLAEMLGTLRSVAIMLFAPPLVLLFWAHLIRPNIAGMDWYAIVLAGLVGFAGAASAPWSIGVKVSAAVLYICVCAATLPFIGLLAVCSTGDCI